MLYQRRVDFILTNYSHIALSCTHSLKKGCAMCSGMHLAIVCVLLCNCDIMNNEF